MKLFQFSLTSRLSKILTVSIIFLYSCGGREKKPSNLPDDNPGKIVQVSDNNSNGNTSNLYAKGEAVYKQNCQACHQANGEGLPKVFPPLAKSDYLFADRNRSIKQIILGSSGEITVNGEKYNSVMPPINLSDEQISDVLNYVLNSWGNSGETLTPEEVKAQR